ncbi:Beta-catenin-like protein 1-like protein [Golovinomyces cichoracearum]|uniref:Beta-catenin-like protein 1-like protein n=1 Tax=Golovinomyces cichoracearum TaxID=62708 RepID=A0A420J999_9PEZI|nr:Beta-catenin-like protein 1-like protein [Golovinomyces cichoracearum]
MSSFEALDSLFKPRSSSLKRKQDAPEDSHESYKSSKLKHSGIRQSFIAEAPTRNDEEQNIDSTPLEDETYGPEAPDDDEGRFFGGGVSQRENEILDYVDEQTSKEPIVEKIDSTWLRRQALKFERIITKNAELRVKYENEPQKFMDSEADLHSEIKALSILSENPELYEEIVKLGSIESLVNLLSHENTDIAIDVVEVISELTDDSLEAEQSQWEVIVNAMLEADLLSLLSSNFKRFDEKHESDRCGVFHSINILENLASMASLAEKIGKQSNILDWLVERVRKRESPLSQNTQYSAELIAILLQSSTLNVKKFCDIDGVNCFLEILANYRHVNPSKGTEEEEYVENLFDALTCVVNSPGGKFKFIEAEGVELCLIMIKNGKMSKSRALRLLDHSLGSLDALEVCERLVEAGGLKIIFSIFMKKEDGSSIEHLLGIFSSLLKLLTANSAYRIRTLAKFVEKDYEKIRKLVKLRREYASRVKSIDEDIKKEQEGLDVKIIETMADECLSKRLDAGLFCLQSIDVILAWLVAEDDGASKRVKSLLAENGETLTTISETLNEQIAAVVGDTEEETMTRDMLMTLVKFLT